MENAKRWIIASNRLPFMRNSETGKYVTSSGGLVTAINGIQSDIETLWCGIAPDCISQEEWNSINGDISLSKFIPLFISKEEYDPYYNGFSNSALWPLMHYEGNYMHYTQHDWECYQKVNRKIAEKICETVKDGDLVWVHDFHLTLVPQMIRSIKPNLPVGFFLHIPFPSSEFFRQLPMRSEILHGMLGADLIGFHDFSYLRHFGSSLELIEGLNSEPFQVRYDSRVVSLGVFPVSIDTPDLNNKSKTKSIIDLTNKFQSNHPFEFTILGVDRLDYSKGVDLKLKGFERFLERYPEYQGKVRLLQIAVPTREHVEDYQELRNEVERIVGRINGKFGTLSEAPVRYLYSTVTQEELLALYRMADCLLVTSKRDGMNLVCQEYIACQDENDPGVVILSEFTGAISNLSHVIAVNPWNYNQIADALKSALSKPLDERIKNHKIMLEYLKGYTATAWAEFFMNDLEICARERETGYKGIGPQIITPEKIASLTGTQEPLYLFLDFDGTLVPIRSRPEEVALDSATKELLTTLSHIKDIHIVIISGRTAEFLQKQCAATGATLAAEHGGEYFDTQTKSWTSLVRCDISQWYERADKLLTMYSSQVPGSFVEYKSYGLAWHYRLSPKEYANYQARKLAFELRSMFKEMPVVILNGNKVIEIKSFEAGKGVFCKWYLNKISPQAGQRKILAIGDDTTDEDMFLALNNELTVKIGTGNSNARYRLNAQNEVQKVLENLIKLRK